MWRVAGGFRAAVFFGSRRFILGHPGPRRKLDTWLRRRRLRDWRRKRQAGPCEKADFARAGSGKPAQLALLAPPQALITFRISNRPVAASSATPMANPFRFLQEVRAEADKVTWPSRRETLITTGLVIVLVIFTSLFFLAVDQALRLMVGLILKLGH